jgi:NAD(P)-dependent dehydrogenase (short-subunit alcohol dehydrogenase family)
VGGPVELVPEQDWRFVFDVNFFGVLALTTAALPLVERAGGRIVHIGSLGGRLSSPGLGPYSATKHALEALAESMRHEQKMSGSRVRTSLVEPGAIETAIWDKGDTTVDEMEARLDDDARRRYGWLIDQSRGFVHEGRRRGIAPDRVAKKVEHALTARRPRARYLVGPDAKIAGFVSRVLPDRGRDGFVRANARHEIKVGRKLRTKA